MSQEDVVVIGPGQKPFRRYIAFARDLFLTSIFYFGLVLIAGYVRTGLDLVEVARAATFILVGVIGWVVYHWISHDDRISLLLVVPAAPFFASSAPLAVSFLGGLIITAMLAVLIGMLVRHGILETRGFTRVTALDDPASHPGA